MIKALLINSNEKGADYLRAALTSCGVNDITAVTLGSQARVLPRQSWDLIVINAPLTDESGLQLAEALAAAATAGVLVLLRSDEVEAAEQKLGGDNIYVIPKPLSKQFLTLVIRLVLHAGVRLQTVQKENQLLVRKMADIRVIDRAKCLLIASMHMTEQQAHHYIEKQAMDLRQAKRQVAESILRTYEM